MDNATKALLIAAAVLIAIVLIALGVKLLESTGDTKLEAEVMSETIGLQIKNTKKSLDASMQELSATNEAEKLHVKILNSERELSGTQFRELVNMVKKYNGSKNKKNTIRVVVGSSNANYYSGRRIEPDEDNNYANFFKGKYKWCKYSDDATFVVTIFVHPTTGYVYYVFAINKVNL